MKKKKIGIIVGRFQPFHKGHLYLIKKAIKENDKVVICISSNNMASFKENYKKINSELKKQKKNYKIIKIGSISSPSSWPLYLAKKCKLTKNNMNYLYKSDENINKKHKKELKKAGICLKFVKRKKFIFKDANNVAHKVESASEIKKIMK